MGNYELSEEAIHDIAKITQFTASHFGENQANKYIRELYAKLDVLAKLPNMAQRVRINGKLYRVGHYKAHDIYYEQRDSDIFILHIRGKRQDVTETFLSS